MTFYSLCLLHEASSLRAPCSIWCFRS